LKHPHELDVPTSTFVLLHQKVPTIIPKLAYFPTFIGGGPKGGRAPLYASIGECPMFQKKESSSFKGKKKENENEKKKKSVFWNLVFPKCIPYDSFMFPPSAQWVFFHVPYVPNSSTLYPICFGPSSSFFVNHIGSPKGKTTLCLFWEWQKFANHTYITRPCGEVLF
jgi:hypothetical protein